jgi:hypothetical protein
MARIVVIAVGPGVGMTVMVVVLCMVELWLAPAVAISHPERFRS